MENKEKDSIKWGYESALNYFARIIKWLVIVIVLLIILCAGSNLAWIIYENQFEDYSETITQQSDTGDNNYIGEDGFIMNN